MQIGRLNWFSRLILTFYWSCPSVHTTQNILENEQIYTENKTHILKLKKYCRIHVAFVTGRLTSAKLLNSPFRQTQGEIMLCIFY